MEAASEGGGGGDGELFSPRESCSGGFSVGGTGLAKKLCNPLEEIRVRSLKTILQKLDLGFVTVDDLGLQLDFVKACLNVSFWVDVIFCSKIIS